MSCVAVRSINKTCQNNVQSIHIAKMMIVLIWGVVFTCNIDGHAGFHLCCFVAFELSCVELSCRLNGIRPGATQRKYARA
jgi:hypothetical protein